MDEAPKLSMASIAGWVKRWVDSLFLRKTGRQTFTGTLAVAGNQTVSGSAQAANAGINAAPSTEAQLDVVSGAAGRRALRVKAAASPTVPVLEVRNSSGGLSVGIWDDQSIRVGGIMKLRATSGNSLANDATLDTGLGYGFVFIYSTTMGRGALFRIDFDGSVMISGSSSHYSTTVDTASRINVYFDGSTIIVQNKRGPTINVRVWMMTA